MENSLTLLPDGGAAAAAYKIQFADDDSVNSRKSFNKLKSRGYLAYNQEESYEGHMKFLKFAVLTYFMVFMGSQLDHN